ncbi:MAG: PHA/PHB synthase family protein [Nitriliruptorales bacterium]
MAAAVLAPEASLVGQLDPMMLSKAYAEVARGLVRHPEAFASALLRGAYGVAAVALAGLRRASGQPTRPPMALPSGDRRFKDPAWEKSPPFFALQQLYLLWGELLMGLVEAADVDEHRKAKAKFGVQTFVDALAPTNFLWGNPAALKRALDTGGASLVRGVGNFFTDLIENDGRPRQVDLTQFEVGRNLAATPGKVVYRNDLMELIQYAPQTAQVYEIPLLCSPPYINKYYIMDLAPDRSFIEWAVRQGHTVFAISYRNPDASMRNVRLDDYLIHGPSTAIDVIRDITGSEKVNVVGLCLGGTLTAVLVGYLEAVGEDRVNSLTLLNTLLDFSEPGALGMFTDPETVEAVARRMRRRGYLEGPDMRGTFDFLRANELIWNYVVSNWLMGEDPPAFDILAWNADSTRIPEAMHAFYLRSCYVRNELASGDMEIDGVRLSLNSIPQDTFIVAAENDHIVPWRSSYASTKLLKGEVEFVLTNAGHVAGIVNPPNPKAYYWVAGEVTGDADSWRATADKRSGSWWPLWSEWIATLAGALREPPTLGSDSFKPIADAPGLYVHDK